MTFFFFLSTYKLIDVIDKSATCFLSFPVFVRMPDEILTTDCFWMSVQRSPSKKKKKNHAVSQNRIEHCPGVTEKSKKKKKGREMRGFVSNAAKFTRFGRQKPVERPMSAAVRGQNRFCFSTRVAN